MLLFLVCAGGVMIASPTFWWIVQSHTSAAEVTFVEHDGARRVSLIGPKAPWPDWVPLPEGATLRVGSYFGPAPGYAAQGVGDLTLKQPPMPTVTDLVANLKSTGWRVATSRFEGFEPTIPPAPLTVCTVNAVREDIAERSVSFVIQTNRADGIARAHWFEGPVPPAFGGEPSDC